MGDRAATPCDRSLGCEATPSTYPAGYALLVARGIGLASVHDSRAERFLPGPDGHVPFSFPRFATHRLARTTLLLCGMFACGAASIDPRTIEAPGTCSALWSASKLAPAVRCLRSGSSNKRMAFPLVAQLALLVRMNSTGGCSAQWVAWGAICPASAD